MTRAEALGAAVRARIEELGLTQAEVSRRSGIAPAHVSGCLRGAEGATWSAATAVRLAAAVSWTVEELLDAAPGDLFDPASIAALPVDTAAAWADAAGETVANLCGLGDVVLSDPEDNAGADRRREGGGRWL